MCGPIEHYVCMYAAPTAQQGGSNLTLYVAILGILGTLAATLITQWWSSRRDERQWKRQKQLQDDRLDREREREEARWEREREQEDARWKRERQERLEQWEREDSARLHQDRLQVYASLLTASEDISRHVSFLSAFTVALEKKRTESNVARVKKCADHIEERVRNTSDLAKTIELIGSSNVNEQVRKLTNSAFLATMSSLHVEGGNPMSDEMRKQVDDVSEAASSLRRQIRRDIGSGEIADDQYSF